MTDPWMDGAYKPGVLTGLAVGVAVTIGVDLLVGWYRWHLREKVKRCWYCSQLRTFDKAKGYYRCRCGAMQ